MPSRSFATSTQFVADSFDLGIVKVVHFTPTGRWIAALTSAVRVSSETVHRHPFSAFFCTRAIVSF